MENVCAAKEGRLWVAEVDGTAVGFVAIEVDNPERGIGTALTNFALDRFKDARMKVAIVETGGDPGHAAAHVREGRLRPPSYR